MTTTQSTDGQEAEPQVSKSAEARKSGDDKIFEDGYRPIGSPEYEEANNERNERGEISVHRLGDAEHSVTLVAQLKVDETGNPVSGHDYDPTAKTHADTVAAYEDPDSGYLAYTEPEKRVVVYEGEPRGPFASREDAIVKAADSGLAQQLATESSTELVRGEPTIEEEVAAMEAAGVSRLEIAALHIGRSIAHRSDAGVVPVAGHMYQHAAEVGVEGFVLISDEEKARIKSQGPEAVDEFMARADRQAQEELMQTVNDLYRPALGGDMLLVDEESGRIIVNPEYEDSDPHLLTMDTQAGRESRIGEISAINMRVRDRHLFDTIFDLYDQGKSPFVVYGGSHITTILKAAEARVEAHSAMSQQAV